MNPIIVRRSSAIGDVVTTLALCAAIKEFSQRPVRLVCHPKIAPMAKNSPQVDSVVSDSVVSTHGTFHVELDGCEHGPEAKKTHLQAIFFSKAQSDLHAMGITLPASSWSEYRPYLEAPLRPDNPACIGVCPSAMPEYRTRWTNDDLWVKFAGEMENERLLWLSHYRPAPGGTPFKKSPYLNLRIQTTDGLLNAIANCKLVVTVDTGPMHIACALNIPVVAISQSFDVKYRIPPGYDRWKAVYPTLQCLNCQQHKCPLPNKAFMPPCNDIDVGQVVKACRELLEK